MGDTVNRVARVTAVSEPLSKKAKKGNYNGNLTVIVFNELGKKDGLKLNLRDTRNEAEMNKHWLNAAQPGNVLSVIIASTNGGPEYIDRMGVFSLEETKPVNEIKTPVKTQIPLEDFKQESAEDLVNGIQLSNIADAEVRIRTALKEIKDATQDIENARKAIAENK
jgi:hypothetical protein